MQPNAEGSDTSDGEWVDIDIQNKQDVQKAEHDEKDDEDGKDEKYEHPISVPAPDPHIDLRSKTVHQPGETQDHAEEDSEDSEDSEEDDDQEGSLGAVAGAVTGAIAGALAGAGDQDSPSRGMQILGLMSRVLNFFSNEDPDDGQGWLVHAQQFYEMQDVVTAYSRWRRVREVLRADPCEENLREFEVAVAALVSFVDTSFHDDEDEEDEEDDDDLDEEEPSDSYELCGDTSSDEEERPGDHRVCARDPCYAFLHSQGANVSPARFRHLTRFRMAFADFPAGTEPTMSDVCTVMLRNLECECLDAEPLRHTWVEAAARSLLDAGSDKCDAIVATRSFYMLERRWPVLAELQEYAGRQRMQTGDPERFYQEERFAVPTPNLQNLLPTAAVEESDCTICGHLVQAGSACYLLSCGHQFHATDCLDGENVLTWLSKNRRCPVCRIEVVV
jgi:hypothetical protein